MVQGGQRPRLPLDPSNEVLAGPEPVVERLEHIELSDRRIFDVVDGAHAPGADEAKDLVYGSGDLLARLVISRTHGGSSMTTPLVASFATRVQ